MNLMLETSKKKNVRKESSVMQIVHALKMLLIEQKLKVGDRIPNEFELSEMFGKSRGSVREAVKILESFGVLEVRQGDGTYVSASANSNMFDALFFKIIAMGTDFTELLQLREILETAIINLVIEQYTDEKYEQIVAAEGALERGIENNAGTERLVELDLDFHCTLVELTGNSVLKNVYVNMMDIFAPFIGHSYAQQNRESDFSVTRHHDMFLQAIRERDGDYGRYAVKKSLQDWQNLNRQYFSKDL